MTVTRRSFLVAGILYFLLVLVPLPFLKQAVNRPMPSSDPLDGFSDRSIDQRLDGFLDHAGDDWRNQDDVDRVTRDTLALLDEFRDALQAGDMDRILSAVEPDSRDSLSVLFRDNPAILSPLADALSGAELSFLGDRVQTDADTRCRIAEYAVKLDGAVFHVVLVQVDGTWYIMTI